MTIPRHIVFDIGRVLIRYEREIPYQHLIPDEQEREWFLNTVCTPDWNVEQDRGRSWEEAETELITQHPEYAEAIRGFRKYWHDMVPGEVSGSVELMSELLEQGHDLTLLTNFAADTFYECCERFPFFISTRGVTVSAEIGLIKPDPAIFRHHADAFDLDPGATLLIDDSADNVVSAINTGWQAVLFTDTETLRADLRRLGI
ncbi:MAG: HAD family hydrolase [Gammaproteobacteria bacterium]